jgi:hypothetical protein
MAKTKRVEREKKKARNPKEEAGTPAEVKDPQLRSPEEKDPQSRSPEEKDPQSRSPEEKDPQLRSLQHEGPQSRETEEETSRLSASSEEAVLDTSLSAQAKEGAPSCINLTVMSRDKESTTVLTVLGRTPNTRDVQQKPEDSAKPVHEEGKDDGSTEVDYEGETSDEDQLPASRNPLSCTRPALTVEPSTTLIQEPALNHEEEIMKESPNAAESAKQVLDGKRILEIAERKEISIKTPVHNHNPQRQGLEDNLFDFGDALVDYTSDGGTIRINQGLATFMLIAASAEAPNRLLMERKREAFDQVTAQAQELLEKQRKRQAKQLFK